MTTASSRHVETMSRLAQWRIENFPSSNYNPRMKCIIEKTNVFTIGKRNWRLVLAEKKQTMIIMLVPAKRELDSPVIASFNIRVVSFLAGRNTFCHPEIIDNKLQFSDPFIWKLEPSLMAGGRLIIEVEFLDLKIESPNGDGPRSIWSDGFAQKDTNSKSSSSLARMLSESILTDITICAPDGSIGAHRAVLAACSPVFHSMFSHDLKEKEMSTINISDMSIEACKAFLSYIYSNIQYQDLFNHRLDLLIAADKYDISDLKDACEERLIDDIDTKNVLERLKSAAMYRLPKLKSSCIQYLVKFGKIFDIREEFEAFKINADRELVGEIINEILSVWKYF